MQKKIATDVQWVVENTERTFKEGIRKQLKSDIREKYESAYEDHLAMLCCKTNSRYQASSIKHRFSKKLGRASSVVPSTK